MLPGRDGIAAGDRGRRLRMVRQDTELGRTAAAFDDMLVELESALEHAAAAQARLRQVLGDASHELRNPLAGMQASTELLLRNEPGRADRERAYVAMIRETRRAGRLVDDLLDNTRHATPPGGSVQLRVECDAGTCAVEITDTGTGIAADDRARVFERLVRLDTSRSRGTGGFGLGLPIARTLAYAHGGDLVCLRPSAAPASGCA